MWSNQFQNAYKRRAFRTETHPTTGNTHIETLLSKDSCRAAKQGDALNISRFPALWHLLVKPWVAICGPS